MLFIIFIAFTGCKDESLENSIFNIQASTDHLIAEQIFNDLDRIIEEACRFTGINKKKNPINEYPKWLVQDADTSNHDTLTIDFGDVPGVLYHGKMRSGKIITFFNGDYRNKGSVFSTIISEENRYQVSGNSITGSRIIENKGSNNGGNIYFSIEVESAVVKTSEGSINWSSSYQKEWINGNDTYDNIYDDRYLVNGTSNGNARNGDEFDVNISQNLHIDLSCFDNIIGGYTIKKGEAIISRSGYTERILSYGNSCDYNVSVTTEGNTRIITLN